MSLTLLATREHTEHQLGGDLRIETSRGQWIRFGVYYGEPPGSHIGFWRTHWGDLRGWNLRIGRRYVGPCLTVFVHFKVAT